MRRQFAFIIRKGYYDLYRSTLIMLDESKRLQDLNKKVIDKEKADLEMALSKSVLILGVASIEALVNSIIINFSKRKKSDLPKAILSKNQNNNRIDRWSLTEKVYFVPTLCNKDFSPPATYFNKNSKAFKKFKEIVDLRNKIMHGKPFPVLGLMEINKNKQHILNTDFENNKLPESKPHIDFTQYTNIQATEIVTILKWVVDSILEYVDILPVNYFNEENIQLVQPVINSNKENNYLMENWKEFIDIDDFQNKLEPFEIHNYLK